MKLITEIKLLPGFSKNDIINAVAKKCNVKASDILSYEIIKQGIDARRKPNVFYVLNLAVEFLPNVKKKVSRFGDIVPDHAGLVYEKKQTEVSPVVVGLGPSGMFWMKHQGPYNMA